MIFEDLAGKKALVTGASGGLGLHFARLLARHQAHVVLAARNRDALDKAVDSIKAEGGRADAVVLDVTNGENVAEVFADADHVLIPTFPTYSPWVDTARSAYGAYLAEHFPRRTTSQSWTVLSRDDRR